jgi:serine/threonine-protein kinase
MAGRRGVSMRRFAITIAVLATALLVTAVWGWRAAFRDESRTAVRFPLTLAPDTRISAGTFPSLAISPDGRYVVFRAARGAVTMLYSRALDEAAEHAIPGTENATSPFFSPDGKWVGFFGQGQLKKVQLSGGAVVPLGTVQNTIARGGTWTKGEVIVVGTIAQMLAVPATGGTPKAVAPLDTAHGEISQRWPLALDDGETVLYTSFRGNAGLSQLGVASLAKGTTQLLDLPGSTAPLAVLEGKLIYVSATGSLMAVPFDERRLRITGAPVPVGDGVAVNSSTAGASAAISRSGSLVFQFGASTSQLVLVDLQGRSQVLVPEAKSYSFPRFSPDGKRIAVGVATAGSGDVWIYDIASGTPRRLTSEGNNDRPEWTPDGTRVLYLATGHPGQKTTELGWQTADGSGTAGRLQGGPKGVAVNEGVISPDGHVLAYRINGPGAPSDLWYRRLDGDTTPKPIATTSFTEEAARFSPDGRWVAYTSDQSGTAEVYVKAFPALGALYKVTAAGGQTPIWARDGRHIYYVADGQVNVATIATTPTFAVTSRQQLFEGTYNLDAAVHANFDLAPDGQHLLLVKRTSGETQTVVVHDWKYELRARTAAQAGKK